MRPYIRACAALLAITGAIMIAGCGRRRAPKTADVPSLARYEPGVFIDVNPKWSHDGSRIAYLRSTPDRKLQLFVVDKDLERPLALLESELVSPDRPYASDLMRYCSPDTIAWSPDDQMIAFERVEWFTFEDGDRIPGTGLWAFNTLSGIAKPLAIHPAHYVSYFYYYHNPVWSPDGRYLAFVGEGVNGQRRVFIHPSRGQSAVTASSRFDEYDDSDWPAWHPQNQNDATSPYRHLLAIRQGTRRNVAGPPTETIRQFAPGQNYARTCGQLIRISASQYAEVSRESLASGSKISPRVGSLMWSPTGEKIVYTLTSGAHDYNRYQLWVSNSDGSEAQRVSPGDGRGYIAPVWIGNHRLGALSPHGDRFEVVILDIGKEPAAVRTIGIIDSSDCDWSPDRSQVVYAGKTYRHADPDEPTGLDVLSTGIKVYSRSGR